MNLILLILVVILSATSAIAQLTYDWVAPSGGISLTYAHGIKKDNFNNILVTGEFNQTADFDPHLVNEFNLTAVDNGSSLTYDGYIQKLDSSGALIWAKSFGGLGNDLPRGVTVDGANNIYITGIFNGTSDFDPGPGVFNLTAIGFTDIFVLKLDENGNFIWAVSAGGTEGVTSYSITNDGQGGVLITGNFKGTFDLDPGVGVSSFTSSGMDDGYILNLDSSGNYLWARTVGGVYDDTARDVAVDELGNLIVAGVFSNQVDFDPGPGVSSFTSNGMDDIYIWKLTSDGDFIWVKTLGAGGDDYPLGVCTDNFNNIYATGSYVYTVDFDPGAGNFDLTTEGANDAYVLKLNEVGDFVWARSVGGTSNDIGTNLDTDNKGNVYIIGNYRETTDFNPGVGVYNLSSMNQVDNFILTLDSLGNFVEALAIEGYGNGYVREIEVGCRGDALICGYFDGWIDANPGPGTAYVNATSAGYYEAYALKLSSAGVYPPVPDSLNLSTLTSECEVTPLTPTASDICSNLIYGVPDVSFPVTTNGTTSITWTYDDGYGNIATQTQDVIITPIDNSVTQVDSATLTANATGYTYQWIDCNNGNAHLSGETNQTLNTSSGGSYAVIIDNGECSDTSLCNQLYVGILENEFSSGLNIYPNPTKETFSVVLGDVYENISITLYDITGHNTVNQSFTGSDLIQVNVNELAAGIYIVEIKSQENKATIKLLIQ